MASPFKTQDRSNVPANVSRVTLNVVLREQRVAIERIALCVFISS
jgi:hypothetical protein